MPDPSCIFLNVLNLFVGDRLLKTTEAPHLKTVFIGQMSDSFHLRQVDVFA
jgi:hypothetical protein